MRFLITRTTKGRDSMAPPQPFRFGLNGINGSARHAWQETARKAEAFGYSTLVVGDHIWTQLAPLTSLVAAAEATTTLRVGSYVFGNDFWHPAVLAREAAPATPSTVPHWRRWATDARVGRARCRYCRSEYANDRRRKCRWTLYDGAGRGSKDRLDTSGRRGTVQRHRVEHSRLHQYHR